MHQHMLSGVLMYVFVWVGWWVGGRGRLFGVALVVWLTQLGTEASMPDWCRSVPSVQAM